MEYFAADRFDDPLNAWRRRLGARCTLQQTLNLLGEVIEWKRAGYGHCWFFFRRASDRMHQNKPRGSMKSPTVGLLTILKNGLEVPPLFKTLSKGRLIKADRLGVCPKGSRVQPPSFSEQSVMHGPITSLCPGTPRRYRRFDSHPPIRSGIIAIYESQLAGFDVFRLQLRPGVTEKLQTVAAGKVRIFDQGDRGIYTAPDAPIVRDLADPRRRERNEDRAYEKRRQADDSCKTTQHYGHLNCWAFLRSSNPTISNGHTTVASLNTSAKQPPSSGETNFPHEMPS